MSELVDVIRPGTTRGLDFVTIDELRKRTGIQPDSVLKFALSEMLCNSLDTDATEINIRIRIEQEQGFCRLEVGDNGSKQLSLKDIKLILDFDSKASSKRGFHMVSRGYLGNALKCIIGYSYALAEWRDRPTSDVIVESHGLEYRITLKPDRIKGVINSEIVTTKREDDGFTTFVVRIPVEDIEGGPPSEKPHPSRADVLENLIFATSMVNPTRKISYDMDRYGNKGTFGSEEEVEPIRKVTSTLWYSVKQFQFLFEDFLKARPETKLKDFIALFRGFTSKKIIGEILQKLSSANHDSQDSDGVQFFPTTPIRTLSRQMATRLYIIMKVMSKPIPKNKRSVRSVLGHVGKESLEKLRERYGWKRLKYTMTPGIRIECPEWNHPNNPCSNINHVEFPFLVEIATFDREEDGKGLKIYQCVNYMASMEDIFSRLFNINYRLGRVGITQGSPVTVVAHVICPVLKWLNYGKSELDE